MKKLKEYDIPFSGLKQGNHEFKFKVTNQFFDSFDYGEFNEADIDVRVLLDKRSTVMEFEMNATGTVNVNCDLSNEPYDQQIQATLGLVVKFGEEFNDEDEDILIIPHGEHQVNIAQYIYEMLVLAVPTKRVHPGVQDGSLKTDMLKKLRELEPGEIRNSTNETDPRWDALKNFLTDK